MLWTRWGLWRPVTALYKPYYWQVCTHERHKRDELLQAPATPPLPLFSTRPAASPPDDNHAQGAWHLGAPPPAANRPWVRVKAPSYHVMSGLCYAVMLCLLSSVYYGLFL